MSMKQPSLDKVIAKAKEAGLVSLDYSYHSEDEKEWKELSDFYALAHEADCSSRDAEIATLRERVRLLENAIMSYQAATNHDDGSH